MWINLCAVFLLIVSIVFIFCAIILMKFYQVEKLSFWSEVFIVTPAYIIALGFYIFVIGFFGISIAGLENRCLLIFYALLMTFCFFAQIGTIFSALELRKYLAEAAASHSNVNYDLNRYMKWNCKLLFQYLALDLTTYHTVKDTFCSHSFFKSLCTPTACLFKHFWSPCINMLI